MYALVQVMTELLSPPGDIGFPCYQLNTPKRSGSYQVIEVSSINGHARLVPQLDHKVPGVQFWLDDALPDVLRT
jgi:hypothetical protein